MKASAASILDLILLCAMLIIGSTMLVSCWKFMEGSIEEIVQEDKTALRNYTGRAEDTFQYSGYDLLLAIVIGDQYEPDVPIVEIDNGTSEFIIDANAESMPLVDNYINKDRITFIQEKWDVLKSFNTNAYVKFSRKWDGGKYIWYVTM